MNQPPIIFRPRHVGKIDTKVKPIKPADQYFNNTVFLSHFQGTNNSTDFVDVKGNIITRFGDTKISTDQFKFNDIGSSGYFDGNGDYLTLPYTTDFQFGSGDLTWECWVRPNNVTPSAYMTILGNALGGNSGNAGLFLAIYQNKFVFRHWVDGTNNATSSQNISINTWYHVAVTKTGSALQIFVDGIKGTAGSTSATNTDSQFIIGRTLSNAGFAQDFFGYLTEVRLAKVLRYITPFDPPTTSFADY